MTLSVERYLESILWHGEAMVTAVEEGGPDLPIPTTPGWAMRDLVKHQGEVHRWATGIVATPRMEPWNASEEEVVGGVWPDDDSLVEWLRDGVDALGSALADAPEDLDCWTFMESPSPRIFWARRQTSEIAIHSADAELAAGIEPTIAPDVAADGVDELLIASLTRPDRGPRSDTPMTIAIESTDTGHRWFGTIAEDAFTSERSDRAAACTVRGSAATLDLFLWNRLDRSAVEVEGDETVLQVWRDGAQI